MKVLFGAAAAAALLMASPAFAQLAPTANCSGWDAAPALPDGATANRDAMTRASSEVDAWRLAAEAKQAACRADIDAVRAQLETMVQAYNQAGRDRVALVNAWNTEVQEYSGRSDNRRDPRSRSLMVGQPAPNNNAGGNNQ
jgi:hypothetical protein